MQSNNTLKGGEIQIRETNRGIEFHAFNFERQRVIHISTLQGACVEKGYAVILRNPEPSFTLTQSEYGAYVDSGAQYLRCIPGDQSATYSISLENFKRHAESYFNPRYGPQLRCPLSRFSATNRTGKRNPLIDTPKQGNPGYERPIPRQLPMFDMLRHGPNGDVF
jgi:hypothetical protein